MGRDDNQQGRGRSGQRQGRRRYQAKKTLSYGNKGPEMKFYPHGSGRKGQSVTYETVKGTLMSYRYGKDIEFLLRDLQKKDFSAERPTRMISTRQVMTRRWSKMDLIWFISRDQAILGERKSSRG